MCAVKQKCTSKTLIVHYMYTRILVHHMFTYLLIYFNLSGMMVVCIYAHTEQNVFEPGVCQFLKIALSKKKFEIIRKVGNNCNSVLHVSISLKSPAV